jgi:hypothetical protein
MAVNAKREERSAMKNLTLCNLAALTSLATLCLFPLCVQAGEIIPGDISGGEYGVIVNCAFPNTIVLDGKFDELIWRHAPWHLIQSDDATVPASSDKDASVKFAVVADDKFIYVAFEITDEEVVSGESFNCEVWNDDSVEIYIDGGNEKAGAYDINDAQITIGADFIGVEPDVDTAADLLGGCVGTTQGPQTETIATGQKTDNGWNLEAAVPLVNDGWEIQPKNGKIIGFNIQYNDDDDNGDRDHKLIWCTEEVKLGEDSWENTTRFAELMFVETILAVDPQCKVTSTWALIKSAGR